MCSKAALYNAMRILNVGSLNIDHVYKVRDFVAVGETLKVNQLMKTSGGKGLNQSIAAAKAGLDVYHMGIIGPEGQFLCDELEKNGVKTEFITRVDALDGHAVIQVNEAGQNCILVYPGTNDMLSLDMFPRVFDQFTSDDILLLQNEVNLVPDLIKMAAAKGMRIAFNPSPICDDILDYPLEHISWLFVNQTEGVALTGERDPARMIERFRREYPDMEIILTLGIDGCIISNKEGIVSYPTIDVPVVDTTGAGDTFTGFYMRGTVMPLPGYTAAECATVASNIAITRVGTAQAIPTIDEVIQYLRENPRLETVRHSSIH